MGGAGPRGASRIRASCSSRERRAGAPGSCIVPLARRHAADAARDPGAGRAGGLRHGAAHLRSASTTGGSRCCSRCSTGAAASISLARDVYVNVAGGVRVVEPGADLGARARARLEPARSPAARRTSPRAARSGSAARCGASRALELRVREAARLGFRRVLVPEGAQSARRSARRRARSSRRDVADAVAWLRVAARAFTRR